MPFECTGLNLDGEPGFQEPGSNYPKMAGTPRKGAMLDSQRSRIVWNFAAMMDGMRVGSPSSANLRAGERRSRWGGPVQIAIAGHFAPSSELDVASQLDDSSEAGTIACALVCDSSPAEAAALYVVIECAGTTCLRGSKDGMIPCIQEFTLEPEHEAFVDWYRLGKREVLEERVRAMEIDDAADCSGRRVWCDVRRVGTPGTDVFGIDEIGVCLAGNAIHADGLLQL